jgi:hypothetical protein
MFALVLVSPDTDDLEARVARLLDAHMQRGLREWWTIGGRYDGLVLGERRPAALPGQHHPLARNRCLVSRLPADLTTHAIVTPDGAWHEGPTGTDPRETSGMSADELVVYRTRVDSWRHARAAVLSAYPDHIAIGIEYGVWL